MRVKLLSVKQLLAALLFSLLLAPSPSLADAGPSAATGGLRAGTTLADSPLQIRSWEQDGVLVAEVHGTVEYPFSRISGVLADPESWCEFIPLVFNIKSCTRASQQDRTVLTLYVGRKFYQTPEEAIRLNYLFRVPEKGRDRFRVQLFAPEGPQGTRDYRIEFEAQPEGDGRTAIRMYSSFRPSLRSRLATQVYLHTAGHDKVGFSVRGYVDGEPIYVQGIEGIVERNTMRYYLALKAFLDTLHLPGDDRFEARLHAWYDSTGKYPRQLYEMDKQEYLDAKRQERKFQLKLQERRGSTGLVFPGGWVAALSAQMRTCSPVMGAWPGRRWWNSLFFPVGSHPVVLGNPAVEFFRVLPCLGRGGVRQLFLIHVQDDFTIFDHQCIHRHQEQILLCLEIAVARVQQCIGNLADVGIHQEVDDFPQLDAL